MIAFSCGLMVLTCIWFDFNVIVTHFLELMLEFAHYPIVKDKKLRLQVTWQSGIMKQILDGCCWLICGIDNFVPACI
jgi:hypothetical protein